MARAISFMLILSVLCEFLVVAVTGLLESRRAADSYAVRQFWGTIIFVIFLLLFGRG
jgi:hypothetical protein